SLSAFRVFGLRVASKQIPQPNRIPIIRLPHRRPAPPFPNHWPRGRHVGRVFEHRSIRPGTRPGLVVVTDHDGNVLVPGDGRSSAASGACHSAETLVLRASTRRTPAPVVPAHLVT